MSNPYVLQQTKAGVFTARISPWLFARADGQGLNHKILSWRDRPDLAEWTPQEDPTVYVVADAWSTVLGSWQYTGTKWTVPEWAPEAYNGIPWGMPGYFDTAGGDHNIFLAVRGLDGKLKVGHTVLFGSNGIDRAKFYSGDAWTIRQTGQSGWADIPIFGASSPENLGSYYEPEKGQSGPWAMWPFGLSDVYYGMGMPGNWHVSTFVVEQEVPREEAGPGEPPPPPSSDTLQLLNDCRADIAWLKAAWADTFR